MRETE